MRFNKIRAFHRVQAGPTLTTRIWCATIVINLARSAKELGRASALLALIQITVSSQTIGASARQPTLTTARTDHVEVKWIRWILNDIILSFFLMNII